MMAASCHVCPDFLILASLNFPALKLLLSCQGFQRFDRDGKSLFLVVFLVVDPPKQGKKDQLKSRRTRACITQHQRFEIEKEEFLRKGIFRWTVVCLHIAQESLKALWFGILGTEHY